MATKPPTSYKVVPHSPGEPFCWMMLGIAGDFISVLSPDYAGNNWMNNIEQHANHNPSLGYLSILRIIVNQVINTISCIGKNLTCHMPPWSTLDKSWNLYELTKCWANCWAAPGSTATSRYFEPPGELSWWLHRPQGGHSWDISWWLFFLSLCEGDDVPNCRHNIMTTTTAMFLLVITISYIFQSICIDMLDMCINNWIHVNINVCMHVAMCLKNIWLDDRLYSHGRVWLPESVRGLGFTRKNHIIKTGHYPRIPHWCTVNTSSSKGVYLCECAHVSLTYSFSDRNLLYHFKMYMISCSNKSAITSRV